MKISVLFGIILAIFFNACGSKENVQKKPNVVLICVDDMNGYAVKDRYDYVKAPYIDKLREESINFINAACNTPVCNPSRSSFFSGIFPHKTGAYVNGSDGWNRSEILKKIRNIPECFRDNGYITWGRGKILHNKLDSAREAGMWNNKDVYKGGFGPFPEEQYQYGNRFRSIKAWEGPDTDFPDVVNADAAIEFLSQKHDKPFFLYYGLWRPHSPYTAPKRFFELYEEDKVEFPESFLDGDLNDIPELGKLLVDSLHRNVGFGLEPEKLWKKYIYAYSANYSFADWNVGRVIEALDSTEYAENTIVILFSDNGFHTGEKLRWGKATLWDQADYVPFIVRTPQKKKAVSKATVSLVDIYPTLIDFCGLNPPDHQLDGNSLVPLFDEPGMQWKSPSFTSYGIGYSSVRTENYRYIRYPDGTQEFYDHLNDPYEFNNVAENPEYKEIIIELGKEIPADWAESLGGRLEVPRDYEKVLRSSLKNAIIKYGD